MDGTWMEDEFRSSVGPILRADILSSGATSPAAIRDVVLSSLGTMLDEPHGAFVQVDHAGGGWVVVNVTGPKVFGRLVLEL